MTWFWLLALSLMDLALISISTTISGGFSSNFFMLCFPAVTAFAMAPAPAVPQSLTSQRIQPGVRALAIRTQRLHEDTVDCVP